jgi:DNA-binding XRE family transcriptional regulator
VARIQTRTQRDYVTGDEMKRILDDECPVKLWREKRGLSQRELAEQAGVSSSFLAEIETGKKPGKRRGAAEAVGACWRSRMENVGAPRPG